MNTHYRNTKGFPLKTILAAICLSGSCAIAGTWQPLTNQPQFTGGYPGQQSPLGTPMCGTKYTPLCNGGLTGIPGQPGVVYGQGAVFPILMTDGSVMVIDTVIGPANPKFPLYNYIIFGDVWKLTPDINGSYVNGTWKQIASLPPGYAPDDLASAVLPDGRVALVGGEENYIDFTYTALGAIYDPVADKWTMLPPPPFFKPDPLLVTYNQLFFGKLPLQTYNVNGQQVTLAAGDAASVVLPDTGQLMVANSLGFNAAVLDVNKLNAGQQPWTEVGTKGKFDSYNEEGWTLLPNGKLLTIDTYVASTNQYVPTNSVGIFCPSFVNQNKCNSYPYQPYPPANLATNSELYDPATDTWTSAGSTINSLTDNELEETGPAVLRPDGLVWATGSSVYGFTSLYDSAKNTWSLGPKFPYISDVVAGSVVGQLGVSDGPASLLPNGNVLVTASNGFTVGPLYFFELDYKSNSLIPQPTIPNTLIDSSGDTFLLLLPTGQVMFTDYTPDVEIYTPSNQNYDPSWAPVIYTSPNNVVAGGTNYSISGIRFNGMSQANYYGDDYQAATNFPLVRIINKATNHVFYCRTHDFSWMGVASNRPVSASFDVPTNIETGPSTLVVVTNGIPSAPVQVTVKPVGSGS